MLLPEYSRDDYPWYFSTDYIIVLKCESYIWMIISCIMVIFVDLYPIIY